MDDVCRSMVLRVVRIEMIFSAPNHERIYGLRNS